jgi:hypothetical protein
MPGLDKTLAICISACVKPTFGKINAHQFSENLVRRRPPKMMATEEMAKNQKPSSQRNMPAAMPTAFQMSPTGIVVMPRKPGGRITWAWEPSVTRAMDV